jgi:hypothetical protein
MRVINVGGRRRIPTTIIGSDIMRPAARIRPVNRVTDINGEVIRAEKIVANGDFMSGCSGQKREKEKAGKN